MRTSWISYGILVSFMVAMKLVIMVARWDVDGFAVVFSWPCLLGVSTAGVLGVIASRPAGFASMWDFEISIRARFLAPALGAKNLKAADATDENRIESGS